MIIDMGQNNRCGKVVVNIPDKGRRTKRRRTFEKKNGCFFTKEKEKEENIWRTKYLLWRRRKGEKYLEKVFCGGEGKGENY